MAEPLDSAVFLEDVSAIVQQQYFDKYEVQYASRFGRVFNKLFKPEAEAIVGDGKTMQFELGPADSVRFQVDPLGNIASPQRFLPGTSKVRWNRQDTTKHDFTQGSARCQFDIYTIEEMSKGTIVSAADRVYDSIQKDWDEKLAIMREAGRTGQLGLVNGTPKQGNRENFNDSTATPTNTTGVRLKIKTGSIAQIRANARYDFVTSAGVVHAGNLRCNDIPNYTDKSASFSFISTGLPGEASTGNVANIVDGDIIVFSGTFNAGMFSVGAYYSTPTPGESFITGADRTVAGNRWMIPQRLRGDASFAAARITKSMFNDAAIAMGYLDEDSEHAVVFRSDPFQHQNIRDEIGEDAFIQYPTGDERAARYGNFGSIGLNYQHGTFGTVKIMSDALARPDRVEILLNNTWHALSYGWQGLRALKDGGSHWYRMNQGTPNTGKGLIYAADWMGNVCDWCTRPWQNAVILSLSET